VRDLEPPPGSWRLRADVQGFGRLGAVVRRLRGGRFMILRVASGGTLPTGTVLTHRRDRLFVYGPTQADVERARSAVEQALRAESRVAELSISRWDEDVADWRQVEPPLAGEARELDEARARAATRHVTRTLLFPTFGRRERAALTRLAEEAPRAGVECTVTERRRRLGVDLRFTVAGPASKVDAFIARMESAHKAMHTPSGSAGP
jgi:hypothetical protein